MHVIDLDGGDQMILSWNNQPKSLSIALCYLKCASSPFNSSEWLDLVTTLTTIDGGLSSQAPDTLFSWTLIGVDCTAFKLLSS